LQQLCGLPRPSKELIMQKMHKKTITKEDGRLLTFYTFGEETAEIAPSTGVEASKAVPSEPKAENNKG
jgi:hypothetical protein